MTPQEQRLTVSALHRDGDLPPGAMDEGWLFVFGSSLAGRHGAGAALVATERYGAQSGFGEVRLPPATLYQRKVIRWKYCH